MSHASLSSLLPRSVVCVLALWSSASAQAPAPVPVAELLPEFVAACAGDDAARCSAVLVRFAAAPDAVAALPQLRAHAERVPLAAMVNWARLVADLLPWAPAPERMHADALAERVEARATAFVKALGADALPELANQQARLWNRGRVDASAPLATLQQQLEQAFEQTREAVCEVLARRGVDALPALPALQHLLTRELLPNGHTKLLGEYFPMRDRPRLAAARAMVAIAPRDERCIAAHALLLVEGSAGERIAAAVAIGGFGGEAVEAVPALLTAAQAEPRPLVRAAIVAIGQVGVVAGAPAIERLEALAAGRDKEFAALAAAALRLVRPAARPGRGA
jgi:hypothetical protein